MGKQKKTTSYSLLKRGGNEDGHAKRQFQSHVVSAHGVHDSISPSKRTTFLQVAKKLQVVFGSGMQKVDSKE